MRHVFTCLVMMLMTGGAALAEPVTVAIDPLAPARPIPEDFAGFSYETAQLLPRGGGGDVHYFRPDNKSLVALFKTLGIRSLRVGGNSVDRAGGRLPADADIDSLFAFARAAGAKVIYSVRLQGGGDPVSAAAIAKYIQAHDADALDCFSIGNEPQYFKTWPEYHDKWKSIVDAVVAAAPGAKICAPDTNPNPEWCRNLVTEFGKEPWFAMITEHDYPGGCSYKNPFQPGSDDQHIVVTPRAELIPADAVESREKLLSPALYQRYAEVRSSMVDAVVGTAIPFRMTETNSFWFGGLENVSDSYASALWALDYLHWWAAHDLRGMNFHTGDSVAAGNANAASKYASFVTTADGFDIHPLSYGLKAFDLGSHGKCIPTKITGDAKTLAVNPTLAVYATLASDNTLTVTIINKSHGAGAIDQEIAIKLPKSSVTADTQMLDLKAPGGDIAGKTGLLLGGVPITPGGTWSGQWTSLPSPAPGDPITLHLAPATAIIVQTHIH